MTDKEFDQLLKGKLENYQPAFNQSSWEDLENRIDNEVVSSEVDPFDHAVRAAMGQLAVSDSVGDWDEMERRIIKDENTSFDEEVRENVESYEAPYDASSWPVLDERITADARLRKRLIGAKILEIAAILIALITFYNVFPDIRNSLIDKGQAVASEKTNLTNHFAITNQNNEAETANVLENEETELVMPKVIYAKSPDIAADQVLTNLSVEVSAQKSSTNSGVLTTPESLGRKGSATLAPLGSMGSVKNHFDVAYPVDGVLSTHSNPSTNSLHKSETVWTVEVMGLPNQLDPKIAMAVPEIELHRKRKSLRFSIGASMDLNALYMPEENFYANGSRISFSEKNLLATGYSAGAGLLFGDGVWSFETGLYYSSKKYEPNRIIQVGKTFDVRTVDFSEISLHIVSVPMFAHWNFDRKGKTRFYAIAGAAVNLIADAHYDLITKNNFRSAPPGVIPDKNTDNEVARIREHILDGAEFSSKSYITIVGGFGVEHFVGNKLSLFAQPTYNYQVPFFQFSDQNGKHFQYLSVQIGTRVRLK